MTEKLMVEWLRGVWDRKSGALPKKREMLVWYACKGNVTEKVKTLTCNINTDLVIIPGGMTSQLKVLDAADKKTMAILRHLYG